MVRSGSSLGTVIRWDEHRHGGLVEGADLPGVCWVDASVVEGGAGRASLRAGQVVEIDWTEPGVADAPPRVIRVVPRVDLQTGLGG